MELKLYEKSPVFIKNTLLIVPYGIETSEALFSLFMATAFNRTLWNWNEAVPRPFANLPAFNRTLWNWNKITIDIQDDCDILLIVPYGIETWSQTFGSGDEILLIVPYGIETRTSE